MLASDRELPVSGGPGKRAYVRDIFTAIAPTYDRLNRIISFRFDQRWRRYAVGRLGWERKPDGIYLDLCAGTLDFAATLARQPGFRGRVVMTLPPQPQLRRVYEFYFRRVLPWIGRRISKHTTAYTWLPESTFAFPGPPELARRLAGQGFREVWYELFMGGVCAMHVGTRV